MRKLLAIVWKENYERFTDRAGLLYMLAAPLALSIILGLAFSGLSGNSGDISISDIPGRHRQPGRRQRPGPLR